MITWCFGCSYSSVSKKFCNSLSFPFTMPLVPNMQRCAIVTQYGKCKNISMTARQFKVDRRTVVRWVRRYQDTGDIKDACKPGRSRKLDDAACELAEGMLLDPNLGNLKDVVGELFRLKKISVSPSTLSRSVKAYCKRVGRPIQADCRKPDKQLTADTMRKRLQFCNDNRARNWGQVMFTDRCKFHFTYVGTSVKRCVWKRVGTRRSADKVNHASCYNVYAGITKYGVTHMHVVAGTTSHTSMFTNKKGQAAKNITGAEYEHVVSSTFLPQGKQLFGGAGMSHWVLQQDNDPSHKKAAATAAAPQAE